MRSRLLLLNRSTRQNKSFGLLLLGLLAGALYLPITLQMMLGTGFLQQMSQSVTLYFFPLCWSALGLGFLPTHSAGNGKFHYTAAGLLALFLICSLTLPLQIDSQKLLIFRIVVCWIPAGFLYFILGRELSSQLSQSDAKVHIRYGIFLIGLVIGGAVIDQAVPYFGGNGIILFLICALLLSQVRPAVALGANIILIVTLLCLDADLHVERLRNVGSYTPSHIQIDGSTKKDARSFLINYATAFDHLAWNRRGQTFFYRDEESRAFLWILNLQVEHILPFDQEGPDGRFIHSRFQKGEKVVLIGVGAGRSLSSIPAEALGKNIFAIERDQNTVDLTRRNSLNRYTSTVSYLVADGRGFIERSQAKWNWIYLESALDQSNASPFQLLQPQNLYTKEAIDTYIDRLENGGTLVFEIYKFNKKYRKKITEAITSHLETKTDQGVQTLFLQSKVRESDGSSTFWALVRKGGRPLHELIRHEEGEFAVLEPGSVIPHACHSKYSDGSPFIDWMCMPERQKVRLFVLTLLVLAFFAGAAEALRGRLRRNAERIPPLRFVFLFQSIAHCFIFLAINYKLRSLFTDEIGTFYVFNYTTALVGAIASFFIHQLVRRAQRVSLKFVMVALVVSLAWLSWTLSLPVTFEGSVVTRVLMFLLGVSPLYFFSSILFHETLGYARRYPSGLREAFFYDSIALLPAYAILPWILFEQGIATLLLSALAFYGLSLLLLYRQVIVPGRAEPNVDLDQVTAA
jgi:hypothetical protein